jgi:hypothetical protein
MSFFEIDPPRRREPPSLSRFRLPELEIWSPVEGLDVSHFPIPIRVESRAEFEYGLQRFQIQVILRVKDRETGENVNVSIVESFIGDKYTREHAEEIIHWLVQRAVLHELDECWFVEDERVRDPHRTKPTIAP